jgi:hypothetical protein
MQDYQRIAEELADLLLGAKITDYRDNDQIDYIRLIADYKGNWCKQAEAAPKAKKHSSKAKPKVETDDGFVLTSPREKAAPPATLACLAPWANCTNAEVNAFMADFIRSGNYNLKYKDWTSTHPMYWREAVSTLRKTMAKIDAGQITTAAQKRCVEYWELWVLDQQSIAKQKEESVRESVQQHGESDKVIYRDPLYYDILAQSHSQGFKFVANKFHWTHPDHAKPLSPEWVAVLVPVAIKWSNESLRAKPDLIKRIENARNKRGTANA